MSISMRALISATALLAVADQVVAANAKTIYRDVAVIGGHSKLGFKTTSTYQDPKSSLSGWEFRSLLNTSRSPNRQIYVDFSTGQNLSAFIPPLAADRTEALRRYLAFAEKYEPITEPGWWNFPSGPDVPSELLLPFRDIVTRYNLSSALPQIFATTGFGLQDVMGSLSIWLIRSFPADMARVLLGLRPGFVPVSRNNQDLYDAILSYLGPDNVLLSSTLISTSTSTSSNADPSSPGRLISLRVRNSETKETIHLKVKRILFTAAPTPENIAPLTTHHLLPSKATAALKKFKFSSSYVGFVSNPALPPNATLANTRAEAQPDLYDLSPPRFPFNTRFDNYIQGTPYYRVIAVGDDALTTAQAKAVIQDAFDKMVAAGTIEKPVEGGTEKLRFDYFQSHGLVNAHFTEQDMRDGAIADLNDEVQGKAGVWWTGAAWSVHLTTGLWMFTDGVLARLVDDLRGE